MQSNSGRHKWANRLFVALLTALVALMFASGFERIGTLYPHLPVDWKMLWQATHGLRIEYMRWVFNPPWSLILLWPISSFSLYQSWGLLIFITMLLSIALFPRRENWLVWSISFLLVITSYPMVQLMIFSGNVDALTLGGLLLLQQAAQREDSLALAASAVLLTSKIQVSWLILFVLPFYLWRFWPKAKLLKSGAALVAFCLPLLIWKGQEWVDLLRQFPHESPYNVGLVSTLIRFGVMDWIVWIAWLLVFVIALVVVYKFPQVVRSPQLGLLTTAGLLLAPYSGAGTLVVPLILGVIPLLTRRVWPHILLALAYNLPMYLLWDFRVIDVYAYFTGVLLLTFAWLVWVALADERSANRSVPDTV